MANETFGTPAHHLHRAFPTTPGTSVAAAHAVDSAGLERQVLAVVALAGEHGRTQDEVLSALWQMPYGSVTGRYSALLRKGLVRDTGIRRPGKSGRAQRVLVATDAGIAALQAASP